MLQPCCQNNDIQPSVRHHAAMREALGCSTSLADKQVCHAKVEAEHSDLGLASDPSLQDQLRNSDTATIQVDIDSAPLLPTISIISPSRVSLLQRQHSLVSSRTIMAPAFFHVTRATTSEDLFGISNVSGFYGPGAWSAWFLTLLASWLAMLTGHPKHNWNIVAYLLCANWAAIDLLRKGQQLSSKNTPSEQLAVSGPIAAPLSITSWGVFHASSQLAYMNFSRSAMSYQWVNGEYRKSFQNAKNRCTILTLGIVFPLCAGIATFVRLHTGGLGFGSHSKAAAHVSLTPTFHWHGIEITRNGSILDPIAFLIECFSIPVICITGVGHHDARGPFSGPRSRTRNCLALFNLFTVVAPTCLLLACVFILSFVSHESLMDNRCIFKPCAPQSITELDQAFALFVSLAMVAFEYFPRIWQWLVQKHLTRKHREEQLRLLDEHGLPRLEDEQRRDEYRDASQAHAIALYGPMAEAEASDTS